MYIKRSKDIKEIQISTGSGVSRQMLISPKLGPNFAMRKFNIQPGGNMPRHTNLVEHEQYVISGNATIGIGDEQYEVNPGDVVFIPAGIPHWYRTKGDKPFEFLCIVPNNEDEITILD